jgi:hypothetical protein
VRRNGVVNEEFDSDRCEAGGGRAPRPMRRRFVGEEELGAVNGKPGDEVLIAKARRLSPPDAYR